MGVRRHARKTSFSWNDCGKRGAWPVKPKREAVLGPCAPSSHLKHELVWRGDQSLTEVVGHPAPGRGSIE